MPGKAPALCLDSIHRRSSPLSLAFLSDVDADNGVHVEEAGVVGEHAFAMEAQVEVAYSTEGSRNDQKLMIQGGTAS